MITLKLNGQSKSFDGDADMPLLWYLRDIEGYTGTKFGCGIAACGACTVLVDGTAVRSCSLEMGGLEGADVQTVESFGTEISHPVQQAWAEENVPQCGYCQVGQMMQAVSFLKDVPNPTDEDIDAYMEGNICRCGTYPRIRAAIKSAAGKMQTAALSGAASTPEGETA